MGALLKASTSLSTLDLSGSSYMAAALARISEGLKASAAPLAELRLGGLIHGEGVASVAARLAALVLRRVPAVPAARRLHQAGWWQGGRVRAVCG